MVNLRGARKPIGGWHQRKYLDAGGGWPCCSRLALSLWWHRLALHAPPTECPKGRLQQPSQALVRWGLPVPGCWCEVQNDDARFGLHSVAGGDAQITVAKSVSGNGALVGVQFQQGVPSPVGFGKQGIPLADAHGEGDGAGGKGYGVQGDRMQRGAVHVVAPITITITKPALHIRPVIV